MILHQASQKNHILGNPFNYSIHNETTTAKFDQQIAFELHIANYLLSITWKAEMKQLQLVKEMLFEQ